MLLIYLSCVWVAGIFLGSRLNLPPLLCLLGLAPLPWLFFTRRHRKKILLASLGIILFVVAAIYSYASLYIPRGLAAMDLPFLARLLSLSNYAALLIAGEWSLKERENREHYMKLRQDRNKFDPELFEALDSGFKILF